VLRAQDSTTKLNQFETYIALIKGYCAILILFLPGAYMQGGYVTSTVLMIVSAIVTTVCVSKLVRVGLIFNLYSYSLVVERVFGRNSRILLDLMIATTQFSFSIS
jgi:amino acid permease